MKCYADIYDISLDQPPHSRPSSILNFAREGVLAFHSLSKRSGLTGFRIGFMAGDPDILTLHARARARFGVGQPEFLQEGGVVAWKDDAHVEARRKIFSHRMQWIGKRMQKLGLMDEVPLGTFYLWCRIPQRFGQDDVRFCTELAEKGVLFSPSSWLSENHVQGWFRIACTLDDEESEKALAILEAFIAKG